jgi:hypothetical protein
MASPDDPRRGPPTDKVVPPAATRGTATKRPGGRQHGRDQVIGYDTGVNAELEPRLGHAADGCATYAALTKRWRERELAALRGRARIIYLREGP